ncbi:substrate-binding domain-containing protein [Motiliproteus sp. SC1-56]|uniref:substrate-binding domain-containing protein n=1 Tax=Motiliproteus sp. SC1-56 TaxID=2799565 RepID=UPI001A8C1B69|nr:substrate-binding domain-containing protein [Motiliproteus sp. SC1-56]
MRSILLMLLLALTAQAQAQPLRLATTTSTYNSGLLEAILPDFTRRTGIETQIIAVGTGAALRMGRSGDADVLLVHAPEAEKAFMAEGHGAHRTGVMYNDFVLVGPASDPAGTRGLSDAVQALRQIAEASAMFISRGDDSGTHKKERALWQSLGGTPTEGYREAGQGMGKVLQIADQLGAYTLTDRGTWLAFADKLDLQVLVEGDPLLFNPYSVITINPKRFPDLNHEGAKQLQQWLTTPHTQQLIADFRINGQPLFVPSANAVTAEQDR